MSVVPQDISVKTTHRVFCLGNTQLNFGVKWPLSQKCYLPPDLGNSWSRESGMQREQGTPWWRHQMETFSALLALCAGNSPVTGEFPHNGQWHGALMFSLICAWTNDWVNNRDVGDLRCHHACYGVIVMLRNMTALQDAQWTFINPYLATSGGRMS